MFSRNGLVTAATAAKGAASAYSKSDTHTALTPSQPESQTQALTPLQSHMMDLHTFPVAVACAAGVEVTLY